MLRISRIIQGQYVASKSLNLADHHYTVTHCDDGSYCCGNGALADACCDEKKGLFVRNGEAVPRILYLTSTTPEPSISMSVMDGYSAPAVSVTSTHSLALRDIALLLRLPTFLYLGLLPRSPTLGLLQRLLQNQRAHYSRLH